jgi:hypothetical protein
MKRKLNLALWIVAGILAVVFLVSSSTKLFVPKAKLAGMGGAASRWVEDFSPGALKAIGALEFLAAVGLIVPAALGIAPVLVPLRPRVLHPADPAGRLQPGSPTADGTKKRPGPRSTRSLTGLQGAERTSQRF